MNREAKEIELPPLAPSEGSGKALMAASESLPFLGNLKVKITAHLGSTELSVTDMLALKPGATVRLDTLVDHPIDLIAEGHVVAQGTLVAIDDHFGVRITTPPKAQ